MKHSKTTLTTAFISVLAVYTAVVSVGYVVFVDVTERRMNEKGGMNSVVNVTMEREEVSLIDNSNEWIPFVDDEQGVSFRYLSDWEVRGYNIQYINADDTTDVVHFPGYEFVHDEYGIMRLWIFPKGIDYRIEGVGGDGNPNVPRNIDYDYKKDMVAQFENDNLHVIDVLREQGDIFLVHNIGQGWLSYFSSIFAFTEVEDANISISYGQYNEESCYFQKDLVLLSEDQKKDVYNPKKDVICNDDIWEREIKRFEETNLSDVMINIVDSFEFVDKKKT